MFLIRKLIQLIRLPFGGPLAWLRFLGWKVQLALLIGLYLMFSQKTLGAAVECETPPPGLLISSCDGDINASLRVLPQDQSIQSQNQLTVAGTYSSGDRFGIEGMAIRRGEVVSARYQSWDGVLIIDTGGHLSLHNAKRVSVNGKSFNLKVAEERKAFVENAKQLKLSVIQSHLLVTGGELDLANVEDAPSFKRRMVFMTKAGKVGIYETDAPKTLYEAAQEIQAAVSPAEVFNLDMGAYDYCRRIMNGDAVDCGSLLVSESKLTNLLQFTITNK